MKKKQRIQEHSPRTLTILPVPSEKDWGSYKDGLDASYAHDLFIGKTNEEMQEHFKRCVIERADELRFMPKVPFRYYMLGFRDYVLSIKLHDKFNFDKADAASCFLGLIEERLKNQPEYIVSIMPDLMNAIEYVIKNQNGFEAKEEIYGSFKEKFECIKGYLMKVKKEK